MKRLFTLCCITLLFPLCHEGFGLFALPVAAQEIESDIVMPFLDFEGCHPPLNKKGQANPGIAGGEYPVSYPGADGGDGITMLDPDDGVSGQSVVVKVYGRTIYPHFHAVDASGFLGFAREYVSDPDGWQFNTYNRLSFWMKSPPEGMPLFFTGQQNYNVGTYCKSVQNPPKESDETGNNHWYHHLNVPNTDTWTYVILNMHPDHLRNIQGDPGVVEHPIPGETATNYFDSLTRFYVSQERQDPTRYPTEIKFDEFNFYREPYEENDEQVYTLVATYLASENRIILTWNRHFNDENVLHEVRYAFSNIHELGWENANPAPNGIVRRLGTGGYNGMMYQSTELPLNGKNVVYFAIKPENSNLFSQMKFPLIRP